MFWVVYDSLSLSLCTDGYVCVCFPPLNKLGRVGLGRLLLSPLVWSMYGTLEQNSSFSPKVFGLCVFHGGVLVVIIFRERDFFYFFLESRWMDGMDERAFFLDEEEMAMGA